MIKRCVSIIMVVFILALNVQPLFGAIERLPTVELKDVKLRGTAISGLFKPIAIIEDLRTKESRWYIVGDALCGGRIVEIQRGAVVLDMNGRRCLFGLPEGELESGVAVAKEEGIEKIDIGEKVGENTWRVELDAAIDMLTKTGRLMKEARIRPYFAVGKAAGVRIDRIKAGSVISEMGFQDGDIIKGVNGFGIFSPTKIFEAYRRYKNDSLIQVQLIREERPETLTYNIVR